MSAVVLRSSPAHNVLRTAGAVTRRALACQRLQPSPAYFFAPLKAALELVTLCSFQRPAFPPLPWGRAPVTSDVSPPPTAAPVAQRAPSSEDARKSERRTALYVAERDAAARERTALERDAAKLERAERELAAERSELERRLTAARAVERRAAAKIGGDAPEPVPLEHAESPQRIRVRIGGDAVART